MTSVSAAAGGSAAQKAKPPVVQPGTGNNIIINPNQRLNPVLECIRNVGKEFGDIVPDFQVGRTSGVLFLSLKYHRLHPEYIHTRIEKLGHAYNLRILLIMCDVSEHQELIRELTKVCLINNITIIVAWSIEEAGQYISTLKQFEHKPPDLIKERVDKDYDAVLRTALTSINKVNKTDVETLRSSLGSFADIARAPSDRLQTLPGFGPVKVRRIKDAFDKPFRNRATSAVFSVGSQVTRGAGDEVVSTSNDVTEPNAASGSKTISDSAPAQSGKGKGKEPAQRSPSPVWDIELDLDTPPPVASSGPPLPREPSPAWDIELDLNDDSDDLYVDPRLAAKKGFGQPGSSLGSDE
ncbi:restriction endonuclease type II-like protein [Suillus fuscotomentosus]|uniref:Restriction endonuclease type II-like protein n=1 Tax=Suillus fuscotomentosus TaxID=1912939 RepID=A0AAD4DWP8_9AGAM|nr:restriction endonuclease type II-like protein [Suillus fuscotomentosus]KAG1895553.1 restriction endonuclease type II-like protein [Suillus fuscotomentosus]